MQRIEWIDSLKGFTMILVVVGHALAVQHKDISTVSESQVMLPWNIIYSFHMPLFMFCSGLLFAKPYDWFTWENVCKSIKKKIIALLIPYFFAGFLHDYIRGMHQLYWFLLILFEFMIITLFANFFINKLKKGRQIAELTLLTFSVFLIPTLLNSFRTYQCLPFFDVDHLILYQFFLLGIFIRRNQHLQRFLDKNIVYSGCSGTFFVSLLAIYGFERGAGCLGKILPFAGTLTFYLFFKNKNISSCNTINYWLQKLGRHSIEMYVIHFFFLFKLDEIGDYCSKIISENGYSTSAFSISIIVAIIQSAFILFLSTLVIKIIRHSKLFSILMFGKFNQD